MKETLEEAAERFVDNWFDNGGKTVEVFEAGAKYQAERMYSEEEMFAIIAKILHTPSITENGWESINEWFEQHKKK